MQSLLHNLCTVGVSAFLATLVLLSMVFLLSIFGAPVAAQF